MSDNREAFWTAGGAAAWVQALASLLTLWIAWAAFHSWSDQEIAKRRADLAIDILSKSFELEHCLRDARSGMAMSKSDPFTPTNDNLTYWLKKGPKEVERCVPITAALEAKTSISGEILGPGVEKKLIDFAHQTDGLKTVWYLLNFGFRKDQWGKGNWTEDEMRYQYEQVGLRYYKEDFQPDGPVYDSRAEIITDSAKSLRDELQKYLDFK